MKEILGISDKLTAFEEKEGDAEKVKDQMPTFKHLFRNSLALATLRHKEKAVVAYDLNEALKKAADSIVVEDEEIAVLRDAVEQNPMQLTNHLWAQLLRKVQSAKPAQRPAPEKKEPVLEVK